VSGFFLFAPCEGLIDDDVRLFCDLTLSSIVVEIWESRALLNASLCNLNISLMEVSDGLGIKLLDIVIISLWMSDCVWYIIRLRDELNMRDSPQ